MGKAEEGFGNDNRWFGVRHRGREPRVIEYPLVAIQSEGRQVPFPRGRKEARAPDAEGLWGNSALLPEVHPIHVDLRVLLRHRPSNLGRASRDALAKICVLGYSCSKAPVGFYSKA
ncbi:hypothetical protein BHE74_00015025 [Ensete ventricosum]|nr:hypothetical protein BHE74_00015025 [Ensete ventricosum]